MSIELLITVVSARGIKPQDAPANLIYIGRRCAGWRQSPLANPFKPKHEGQRTWVIDLYTEWLWGKMKEVPDPKVTNELSRIAGMVQRGEAVQLGCWCSPLACHGDVVKEAVLWWIANKSEVTA